MNNAILAEFWLQTVTSPVGDLCKKASAGLPFGMQRLGGVVTKSMLAGLEVFPAAAATTTSTMLSGSFLLLMLLMLCFWVCAYYLSSSYDSNSGLALALHQHRATVWNVSVTIAQ